MRVRSLRNVYAPAYVTQRAWSAQARAAWKADFDDPVLQHHAPTALTASYLSNLHLQYSPRPLFRVASKSESTSVGVQQPAAGLFQQHPLWLGRRGLRFQMQQLLLPSSRAQLLLKIAERSSDMMAENADERFRRWNPHPDLSTFTGAPAANVKL